MNPIQISQELQKTLISYLLTTFDVNRDGQEPELANALQEAFEAPGALFQGPFLEVTPPYRTGRSLEMLTVASWLSPDLLTMDCFQRNKPIPPTAPLYAHQEKALEKLIVAQKNVVISSGTGSGKTESFLIPILNDLLVDDSLGVRAILIYPMNALVNDQLDRLRELLQGTNITFGRYTSELVQTRKDAEENLAEGQTYLPNEIVSREEIRSGDRIPQILITNYAMLEYLLLRPDDAPLFQQGNWKYLVLDEAHTYTGAKAIEVSLLIRRLKHRLDLPTGHMRCIATSATLTSDNAASAAEFASKLFGEMFTPDDVIFGETDPHYVPIDDERYGLPPTVYLHEEFPKLLDEARLSTIDNTAEIALWLAEMGLIAADQLDRVGELSPQAYLWRVLKGNEDITRLRDWLVSRRKPVSFKEAAAFMFEERLPTPEDWDRALYHLVELAALARPGPDKLSLLPARYHLFARSPHGAWVCLNPDCAGKRHNQGSGWSRLFAYRRDRCDMCHSPVYPLTICRTCGQVYVRMMAEEDLYLAEATDIFSRPQANYFTWSRVAENQAYADVEDDDVELILASELPQKLSLASFLFCLRCQKAGKQCQCASAERQHINLWLVEEKEEKKSGQKIMTRANPITHMTECARCHDREILKGQEVVREVSMATINPLSVVTQTLYRHIPQSAKPEIQQKPGGGRKLLTFYDSRQGAAAFAAFLQDVSNQELYRHIIPVAIGQIYQEKNYLPDLTAVSDRGVDIGWQARIFHHDPHVSEEAEISTVHKSISKPQKDRLAVFVKKRILAEFTTQRRLRRSLESLGLAGLQYFEPDQLPDFALLADQIDFTPVQSRTLVEYLLDGLRNGKVITLPDGIARDDPVFGRNTYHPSLIRSGKASKYEVAWIGATPRQARRTLVQKMLEWRHLPATDSDVEKVLSATFDWLRNETNLLVGDPANGYRLNSSSLFFQTEGLTWYRCNQCRRLHYRGDSLICPASYCSGNLQLIDVDYMADRNYYFQSLKRHLLPVRVEEHTAQLATSKGQEYQRAFKNGDVNILSCSTTFEMGIDLGDLQSVVLSNVPPTVANYKQRSGRAGRRAGGTAFILVWAGERPHDQSYFSDPLEIMDGAVQVPYLAVNNALITQRHINAIVLSAFLRYQKENGRGDLAKIGPFFDANTPGNPHIAILIQWLDAQRNQIASMLSRFAARLDIQADVPLWLEQFAADKNRVQEIYEQSDYYYNDAIDRYESDIRQLTNQRDRTTRQRRKELEEQRDLLENQLLRLRDEDLIGWLSDNGLLPSYSFPIHTINLRVPPQSKLRLQRDLRLAISEYAPGQEIVADKRLWLSRGLDFRGKEPLTYEYHICDECNHLQAASISGAALTSACPICQTQPAGSRRGVQRYLVPDGFWADTKGRPAGQAVIRQQMTMRSALFPATITEWTQLNSLAQCGYDRHGELLYVNEGVFGRAFTICPQCGQDLQQKPKCTNCQIKGEKRTLGFKQKTDTLHLQLTETPDVLLPGDFSGWISLLQAFIQGACRALQIERRDIGGVLYPIQAESGWQQTIVLYDDVPGGAGHVKRIQDKMIDVVEAALAIVNCPDCAPDTSCYHCLRDYSNQTYHALLRRDSAAAYLEALFASFNPVSDELPGVGRVVAISRPRWLAQQMRRVQSRLWLAVDELTLDKPIGEHKNWLDMLQDLLLRGCQVDVSITSVPKSDRNNADSLLLSDHLRLLLQKGLRFWQIEELPGWTMLIDNDRAIKPSDPVYGFSLNAKTGQEGMLSTTHSEAIGSVKEMIAALRLQPVPTSALELPSHIQLIRLPRSQNVNREISEKSLFGQLFQQPVTRLLVNDRYLLDEERLYNRLGEYLDLADRHGTLKEVEIRTWAAGQKGRESSTEAQDRAVQKLRKKFPSAIIELNRKEAAVEHDRFILIFREDGSRARILIGQGLDFIRPDGSIQPTHVVIEDPCSG